MMVTKDPNPKWWLKSVPKVNTWSDINVLHFLRLYQQHPVLWNVHNSKYKNFCAKQRSYKHIVELLNLRDVDVEKCKKLVELLKKKYVEEKEVKRSKFERRPTWFEIIRRIVMRILNPEEIDCCMKQCCTQCCGCETPSESTLSSDFQACKDCCADQNLHPPCEYYKCSGKSSDQESDNRCNFENVECYTICNDEVKVVLLNIGDGVKKYNSNCDWITMKVSDSRNSDCNCKTEDESSKKSNSDCVCCCKSESLTQTSSSSEDSNCNCQKSSTANSLPSVSTVAQFCIQQMPANQQNSSEICTSTSMSIVNDKSAGIFMDSQRFHGKRISLVDEYMRNDCGVLEPIPPRLHFARCCCDSDFYPLQVEL